MKKRDKSIPGQITIADFLIKKKRSGNRDKTKGTTTIPRKESIDYDAAKL